MGPKHKLFSAIFSHQEYLLTCIGGTLTQNLFANFQLSRTLIDMHWWDLATKSFRRFSAIKNTYWHVLVGPYHKIFSPFFSYQEYLLTCIGGTLTQNLFGDFQLSRILIDMNTYMYWWTLSQFYLNEWNSVIGESKTTTKLTWSSNNERATSLWTIIKWIQNTNNHWFQSKWQVKFLCNSIFFVYLNDFHIHHYLLYTNS